MGMEADQGPNPASPTAADAWAGVKAKASEVVGRAKDSAEKVVEGAKGAWENAKEVRGCSCQKQLSLAVHVYLWPCVCEWCGTSSVCGPVSQTSQPCNNLTNLSCLPAYVLWKAGA